MPRRRDLLQKSLNQTSAYLRGNGGGEGRHKDDQSFTHVSHPAKCRGSLGLWFHFRQTQSPFPRRLRHRPPNQKDANIAPRCVIRTLTFVPVTKGVTVATKQPNRLRLRATATISFSDSNSVTSTVPPRRWRGARRSSVSIFITLRLVHFILQGVAGNLRAVVGLRQLDDISKVAHGSAAICPTKANSGCMDSILQRRAKGFPSQPASLPRFLRGHAVGFV